MFAVCTQYHSPLEGESARGRSPQSSRRGANAASRRAGGGQTRRPVSDYQSIQVEEMAEAVPGLVRAGRPRSREAIIVRAGRPRSREAIIVRAGRPRSREAIIMRAGRPRSRGDPFWALRAVEAAPYRFVALRGSSCPFVDISFSFVALRGSSLFLAASFDFFSIQVI